MKVNKMLISEIDKSLHEMIIKEDSLRVDITGVYDTTVCGYCNNKFVTILSSGKNILPMSLVIVEDISKMSIKLGDVLTISQNKKADLFIDKSTNIVNLTMEKCDDLKSASIKYEELSKFLSSQKVVNNSMLPIIKNIFPIVAKEINTNNFNEMHTYISEQTSLILSNLKEKLNIKAKNIIGYGVGLTPSADDFLLGMLSVFDYYNQIDEGTILRNYIEQYYHTTTEVSKWMLLYGCELKEYPYIVKQYFETEFSDNRVIEKFLKHGSSSGIDLLCGILSGLSIVMLA